MTINIIHKEPKNKKLISELKTFNNYITLVLQNQNTIIESQKTIINNQHFTLKNQHKMANQLDEISADLDTANTKIDNITADITNLDEQIAALSNAPTPAEIAAVKEKSAAIVARLTTVDDMTLDVTVASPIEPAP